MSEFEANCNFKTRDWDAAIYMSCATDYIIMVIAAPGGGGGLQFLVIPCGYYARTCVLPMIVTGEMTKGRNYISSIHFFRPMTTAQ